MCGYVFCNEDGTPYNWRQYLMKILCKRAGVKHFTFHAIRHLTASILFHDGYPVMVIQGILRHKNPLTTTRYLHRRGLMENVLEEVFGENEE